MSVRKMLASIPTGHLSVKQDARGNAAPHRFARRCGVSAPTPESGSAAPRDAAGGARHRATASRWEAGRPSEEPAIASLTPDRSR